MSVGVTPSLSATPDYYSLGPPAPPPPTVVSPLAAIPEHHAHHHDAGSNAGTTGDHAFNAPRNPSSSGLTQENSVSGLNVTV